MKMRTEYLPIATDDDPDSHLFVEQTGQSTAGNVRTDSRQWKRVSKTYALPCVAASIVIAFCLYEVASDIFPDLPSLVS